LKIALRAFQGSNFGSAKKLIKNLGGTQMKLLLNLHNDEAGQDLIEYALVAALIALGATAAMTAVATGISTAFSKVVSKLTSAIT
jgi:pilus assembly protein Flp/PilA